LIGVAEFFRTFQSALREKLSKVFRAGRDVEGWVLSKVTRGVLDVLELPKVHFIFAR
jgi:hypothetical protein